MKYKIEWCEVLFSEITTSFEKAEEALGRAERYIGRLEAKVELQEGAF